MSIAAVLELGTYTASCNGLAWLGSQVNALLPYRFKYVLIRVTVDETSKLIVRGSSSAEYHNDVLHMAVNETRVRNGAVQALGGGRIEHDVSARSVRVFGYSMAFGSAVHEVAAEIVRRSYPWYDRQAVTVSYDGY